MPVANVTCCLRGFVSIFASVDDHAKFGELSLVYEQEIFEDHNCDTFDNAASMVDILGAD